MKSNFIIKSTCTIAVLALISCQNETNEMYLSESASNSLSLEQLEKIAYGCDSYVYDIDSDEKVETSASDEYMALIDARMDSIRRMSVMPKSLKAISNRMVGVVKDGTCNGYEEIRIFYDCEDKNPKTKAYDYAERLKWVDKNKNLDMRFCMVPASLFKHIGQDYAVVNFSSEVYTNEVEEGVALPMRAIDLFMDSEDDDTKTKIEYSDGTSTTEIGQTMLDSKSKKNLILNMLYYTHEHGVGNKLPDLGFDYGVFGQLDNCEIGTIYSDDQDHFNSNNAKLHVYNPGNPTSPQVSKSIAKNKTYAGFLKVTENTTLYISHITTNKQ